MSTLPAPTLRNPGLAKPTALYEATADPRGFFESVLGFGKLAGQWIRLSKATQLRYFGDAPFGRRAIKVDDNGKVTVYKSQAYGKDWDFWEIGYDHANKGWFWWSDNSPCNSLPRSW